MKRLVLISMTAALMATAGGAAAQQGESVFDGFSVGATVDYRRNESRTTPTGLDDRLDRRAGGVGYRVYGGYDHTVTDQWLVGAEVGVGGGGKPIEATATGGDYRLDPSLTYDVSARAGFLATPTVLLYGRAGYQWLKTEERVRYSTTSRPTVNRDETQGGVLYGFGAEWAVSDEIAVRAEFDQTDFGDGLKAAQVQLGATFRF